MLPTSLTRLIEALHANADDDFSWELIVCDNHSTDATAAIAAAHGATVITETVRGIAYARNAGARAATGDWLLFIDADSYPSAALLNETKQLLADELTVGCGSTVKGVGGTWWMRLRLDGDNTKLRLFGLAAGVFLLCRRDAFEAIGGFSTNLYALEEIDFVLRLRRYGRKQKQRFRILTQHPVRTSARIKGKHGVVAFLNMVISILLALIFLLLHLLFPRLHVPWFRKLLRYWYAPRE